MTRVAAALGLAFLAGCLAAVAVAFAEGNPAPDLKYHAFVPAVSRAEQSATAAPTPAPDNGPVVSLYLASASITQDWPVEERDTVFIGSREVFADPTAPNRIAWYPRFGRPGNVANSIFAAHINYVNYGNGPFAYLTSAHPDDALYVTMADGAVFTYSVKSVAIISLRDLDMNLVVFPPLDGHTERVTLISCGGTFVPRPGGGGEYESRVVLVAERYHP
jgi:hypothetical protein